MIWLALAGLGLAVPTAGAYVYWATPQAGTISRATNDGATVQPDFIATLGNPSAISVDAGHIYWASYAGHSIGRAGIDGGAVEPEFIKLPYAPTGLAVNESHVYWAADTLIGRADLNGTGAEPEFIKKNVGFPCGLTVDSGHLYWPTGVSGPGYVERAPLNGSTVEYEFVAMSPVAALCGIAVNTTNVFWGDNGFGGGTNIGRANLSNGKGVDTSFIGQALGPCELALLGSKLYWANSGTSTIARANTDSTGVEYEWIHTGAPKGTICGVAVDNLSPPPPPPPSPGPGTGPGPAPAADRTPPQTTIASGPGGKLADGIARFAFRSSEPGSSFECRLDARKAAGCRSPKRYRSLKPGRHRFKVWATDAAGNEDPSPAKLRFRVPAAG